MLPDDRNRGGASAPLVVSNDVREINRALLALAQAIKSGKTSSDGTQAPFSGGLFQAAGSQGAGSTEKGDKGDPGPRGLRGLQGEEGPQIYTPQGAFLTFTTLAIDPHDGLPAVDANGYAIVEEMQFPVINQILQSAVYTFPSAGGTYQITLPPAFNETSSCLFINGSPSTASRLEFDPGIKHVVIYNSMGTDAVIALQGANPQDPGVTVKAKGVAWIQVNSGGTGLEKVTIYG